MPVPADVFRARPTVDGERIRLVPLSPATVDPDEYLAMIDRPEGRRLTGTHHRFDLEQVDGWLSSRAAHHDRADWALVSPDDETFLGEVVLLDLDADNESVALRISLAGPHVDAVVMAQLASGPGRA